MNTFTNRRPLIVCPVCEANGPLLLEHWQVLDESPTPVLVGREIQCKNACRATEEQMNSIV